MSAVVSFIPFSMLQLFSPSIQTAELLSDTDPISERSARALRREKRKEHPSASPEPRVKAVKPVKKQKRNRPARQHRSVKSSDKGCVRPGLPYGESDSGEECINVALPQYILDRIKAEEEEDQKIKFEEDVDKRIKTESKESVGKPPSPVLRLIIADCL
jgi:hypothetical protein